MGTPSYMAPEQAEGRIADIGPLADVYSLGATLYDLLSDRPPFKGTTVRDTLKMVIEQDPLPPRQLRSMVPRDLETICMKCLQKLPEQRYKSAAELADDLQRFLNGEPITARPVSRFEKSWRWCRRKPALAALSGISVVALLSLLVGAFLFTYAVADDRREKEVAQERAATDRADRSAALAKQEAALASQEAAEVKRKSADDMRRTSNYFAQVARTRERLVTRDRGWTWAAAAETKEAAAIDTPSRDPAVLRSAFASAVMGTDAREARTLAAGFHSRVLCYHPNGRWLVLAEGRAGQGVRPLSVLIVDTRTGETLRKFSFPAGFVGTLMDIRPDMAWAIAISPDGHWLVVGTRSGSVHRWDLRAKSNEPKSWSPEHAAFGTAVMCDGLAFAPDGSALYVATRIGDDGTVTRWDTTTWKRTARDTTERAFGGLCVNPAGNAIYRNNGNYTVTELDPLILQKKGDVAREMGSHAISPDLRESRSTS